MRLTCLPILVVAICAAEPALADAITETIAFSGSDENGVTTVSGPVFNASLGTLTGVSITITGTLTPDIFTTVTNAPTSAMLDGYIDLLGAGGPPTVLNGGTFTLTQNGAYLTGAPEAFSFTEASTNLAVLNNYISSPGYMTTGLANLDIYAVSATPGAWGSQADSISPYSGEFAITYTYDVPEPASLALLAFGATLLPLARATRKR
jgi:hypothetical protein